MCDKDRPFAINLMCKCAGNILTCARSVGLAVQIMIGYYMVMCICGDGITDRDPHHASTHFPAGLYPDLPINKPLSPITITTSGTSKLQHGDSSFHRSQSNTTSLSWTSKFAPQFKWKPLHFDMFRIMHQHPSAMLTGWILHMFWSSY